MNGNSCLLDTSIIIQAFRKDNVVLQKLDNTQNVYVSVTVIGELYFGAYKSGNVQKHLNQIHSFISNCKILTTDTVTADLYGSIKTLLSKKGTPIPENDIWIAASARQHKLPVYTKDHHFSLVDKIDLF